MDSICNGRRSAHRAERQARRVRSSGPGTSNDDDRHSIWIVGTITAAARAPPDEIATSPRFSPDGSRLIYAVTYEDRAGHKTGEIRMRWMDSGDSARLASLAHPPRQLTFSPDGKRIAFAMFVDDPPDTPIAKMPQTPKGANWGPDIKVIDRLVLSIRRSRLSRCARLTRTCSHDRRWRHAGTSHDGDFEDDGSIAWTPDGTHLIFTPTGMTMPTITAELGSLRSRRRRRAGALTDREGPDPFGRRRAGRKAHCLRRLRRSQARLPGDPPVRYGSRRRARAHGDRRLRPRC
jgi:dipeptidyl aminopeptidase/acylaminoacyl peptidase